MPHESTALFEQSDTSVSSTLIELCPMAQRDQPCLHSVGFNSGTNSILVKGTRRSEVILIIDVVSKARSEVKNSFLFLLGSQASSGRECRSVDDIRHCTMPRCHA